MPMSECATRKPTIFALSTAPGRAGVAVIRVSGKASLEVLHALGCDGLVSRRATYQRFQHPRSGEVLDRGLAIWFPAPNSFSGEDMAEFHVHGGRAVVQAMVEAIAATADCRPAEPGEFSRRAFDNGRIDLAEAEGLADLIDAETEAQRRQALRQAEGQLSLVYEGWRDRIIATCALVEAAIDFSDEGDVGDQTIAEAEKAGEALRLELNAHLQDNRRGEIIRDGFRIVLAGRPNVGKSSLLNKLLQREAAIVSPEAGTTRDVIEARLDLGGFPVVVFDTAGIRTSESPVEQEGVKRAISQARVADLVVVLRDAVHPEGVPELVQDWGDVPVLHVWTKSDLMANTRDMASTGPDDCLAISSKTGAGLDELVRRLTDIVRERIGATEEPAITQARHRRHLEDAVGHLAAFCEEKALERNSERKIFDWRLRPWAE